MGGTAGKLVAMPTRQNTKDALKVPVSCLADFVNSPGRSAESLLRPYKFNKRGEGFARSGYYKHALTAIRNHHTSHGDPKVFQTALVELHKKAQTTQNRLERTKSEKNAQAIEAYQRVYKDRNFAVLPNHCLAYRIGPVVVTAQPDLWVEENGTQVLLKIGIAKKKSSYADILLTVIRKAAISSGYRVRAKNVVYLNVTTGKEMICQSSLRHFNRTFGAIARDIAATWPNVTPPPEKRRKSHAASA
jgi:hypothetical protein